MWRKLTEEDLIAALSRREVEAFRRDFEVDTIPQLLSQTSAMVRGYIRNNGNVRMSPEDGTIPESCVGPAIDYVVISILKRIALEPTEARSKARDAAITFFRDIASGHNNPESYLADESAPTGGSCAVVIQNSRTRVSSRKLEGL